MSASMRTNHEIEYSLEKCIPDLQHKNYFYDFKWLTIRRIPFFNFHEISFLKVIHIPLTIIYSLVLKQSWINSFAVRGCLSETYLQWELF